MLSSEHSENVALSMTQKISVDAAETRLGKIQKRIPFQWHRRWPAKLQTPGGSRRTCGTTTSSSETTPRLTAVPRFQRHWLEVVLSRGFGAFRPEWHRKCGEIVANFQLRVVKKINFLANVSSFFGCIGTDLTKKYASILQYFLRSTK